MASHRVVLIISFFAPYLFTRLFYLIVSILIVFFCYAVLRNVTYSLSELYFSKKKKTRPAFFAIERNESLLFYGRTVALVIDCSARRRGPIMVL